MLRINRLQYVFIVRNLIAFLSYLCIVKLFVLLIGFIIINVIIMEPVFYKCPICGNVVHVMVASGVVPECCGHPMHKLEANVTDGKVEAHVPKVQCKYLCEDPRPCFKVTAEIGVVPHPALKEHHICFIFLETMCGGEFKFLKPEQEAKVSFYCKSKPVAVYAYCNLHSLWKANIDCPD